MRPPNTADERERRFVEYVLTLNKSQIAEFKLTRLNRIANFRRRLMELLNEMIETRAEDLAAGMLMEYAPERTKPAAQQTPKRRLPLADRKRVMPLWVRGESKTLLEKRGWRIQGEG